MSRTATATFIARVTAADLSKRRYRGAHAAKLFLKARIAQEHPLLIFEQVPKPSAGALLDFEAIASQGRTYQYSDLPGRLWAATGLRVANEGEYREFGKLRNTIQHCAAPDDDLSLRASRFVFSVLDPFIGEQWGLYAIDYNEDFGDHYEHILTTLVAADIRPRLSPNAVAAWSDEEISADAPAGYRAWFKRELERGALGED